MHKLLPLPALVFALLLAGTSDTLPASAPATSPAEPPANTAPKIVREIFVPFEDLNVLLENQPRRVLLSRTQYEELIAKAIKDPALLQSLASAPKPGDEDAPAEE